MHSLYNYLVAYEENKPLIHAYLQNQHVEHLHDSDNTVLGFGIGIFLIILLISIALWIWAIVALVKYWKVLPSWAQVLGVIGLLPIFPGGPILTLIVVYIGKQN